MGSGEFARMDRWVPWNRGFQKPVPFLTRIKSSVYARHSVLRDLDDGALIIRDEG